MKQNAAVVLLDDIFVIAAAAFVLLIIVLVVHAYTYRHHAFHIIFIIHYRQARVVQSDDLEIAEICDFEARCGHGTRSTASTETSACALVLPRRVIPIRLFRCCLNRKYSRPWNRCLFVSILPKVEPLHTLALRLNNLS